MPFNPLRIVAGYARDTGDGPNVRPALFDDPEAAPENLTKGAFDVGDRKPEP